MSQVRIFSLEDKSVSRTYHSTIPAAERGSSERNDTILPQKSVCSIEARWDLDSENIQGSILFNQESEVRGPEFVTRKISRSVARIFHGSKGLVVLGNLSAVKDWRYARVYVEGVWMMLQQNYPDDFVLGTGESHTVREFAEAALKEIDMDLEWIGSGMNEVGLSEGMTRVEVSRES